MIFLNLDFDICDIEIPPPEMTDDVEVEIDSVISTGGNKDHNQLINREIPDQHPIEAITDLRQELDDRPEAEAITNMELDSIWNLVM